MPGRTIAIMQPYAFPYLGYFHLVEASDIFVFYDDVTFIKGGWINRNTMLVNGQAHWFTVPLSQAGSNRSIHEIALSGAARFRTKFLKTLDAAYRKAPYYDQGRGYVEAVLGAGSCTIAELSMASITMFYRHLGLARNFEVASQSFAATRSLGRVARLARIVQGLQGTRYVNASGGRTLYTAADFAAHEIELSFVETKLAPYRQTGRDGFLPGLSIIDILMHNAPEAIGAHLGSFSLELASDPPPT